jgi:hypothetical protein
MRNKPGAKINSQMSYQLPKAPPRPLNTGRENVRAAATKFLDGVLPGSAEAARGVREVVINAARAPFTDEEFDPSKAYNKGEDDIRRVRAEFEDKHENAAAGLQAGGMVTGMAVLPEARLFRGGSLAAGMGNGMATGATYGFVSGALNDTGNGRVDNAINGTLFGSALGGTLPAAVRGTGALADAARRNIPGVDRVVTAVGGIPGRLRGEGAPNPDASANAQAERILGDMLPNGHIATGMGTGNLPATPANITAEVAARANRGVPAVPADVSEQGRRVTSWALQGNGPMAQRARSVLSARQAQAGQRIRGHLADELGPAVDPIQEAEAITRRASDAAEPAYREAYSQGPMVIDEELQGIMRRPAFQDALPQAYRNIQNRGGDPEAMGFTMQPDGSVILSQQPSFEAFDQVVRTLNKDIKRSELTGRPILDNESGGVNDAMRALDGHLKAGNDAYRAAKGNFANEMVIKDAMARGQDLPKLTGPEIESQLRTMPRHAQEAWMAGGRTALADFATDVGLTPAANVAQRVRQAMGLSGAGSHAAPGDAAKLQAIETMSGRPGVMNRLDDRLEGEDQAFKTFSESFGNSKSQPRQAMDDQMSGEAMQTARQLLHGNWTGAIAATLFKGNPAGTTRFKQGVQDRIAEIMTSANPQTTREAMDAIVQRSQTDDEFGQLLNMAGIKPAKLIALQAAAQDAHAAPFEDEEPVYTPEDFPAYTSIQP